MLWGAQLALIVSIAIQALNKRLSLFYEALKQKKN